MTESKVASRVDFEELKRREVDFYEIPTIKEGTKNTPGPMAARIHNALTRLLSRGIINQRQHDAGERLLEDYFRATRTPVAGLDRVSCSPNTSITDIQLDASRAVQSALDCGGKMINVILIQFILGECAQLELGKEISMHRNYVPGAITLALDTLADHYGIV